MDVNYKHTNCIIPAFARRATGDILVYVIPRSFSWERLCSISDKPQDDDELCHAAWLQGLYRLAEMIEEGFRFAVDNSTLSKLQVPATLAANNMTLVMHLYSR